MEVTEKVNTSSLALKAVCLNFSDAEVLGKLAGMYFKSHEEYSLEVSLKHGRSTFLEH